MPDITLYGPVEAPFTTKVRGALALKKLEYTFRQPESPDDYQRWSPKSGLLPAIEIDGAWTEDSSKILDRLDELFPETSLVAPETKIASSQRRLEEWSEAAFMFYWQNYLRAIVNGEEVSKRKHEQLGEEFLQRLDDLVNFLGNRPFFYADQPSRADVAVFSFVWDISEAMELEVGEAVAARPTLHAHVERMAQLLGWRHGKPRS